jgi:hypothetical protein
METFSHTVFFNTVSFESCYGHGNRTLQAMADLVEQIQSVKPRSGNSACYYHAIDEVRLSEHFIGLANSLKSVKPSLVRVRGATFASS